MSVVVLHGAARAAAGNKTEASRKAERKRVFMVIDKVFTADVIKQKHNANCATPNHTQKINHLEAKAPLPVGEGAFV